MNKLIYTLFLLPFLLVSCGGELPKSELRDCTEAIITQYPNFESNDIAKEAVAKAVVEKSKTLLNQPTTFFDNVEFRFLDLMEGENGYNVLMECDEFCEIDAPKGSSNKYVIANAVAQIVGQIDETTAAQLDKNKKYFIRGTIEGWQEDPLPHSLARVALKGVSMDGIFYGAFSIKDLKLTEAPHDK